MSPVTLFSAIMYCRSYFRANNFIVDFQFRSSPDYRLSTYNVSFISIECAAFGFCQEILLEYSNSNDYFSAAINSTAAKYYCLFISFSLIYFINFRAASPAATTRTNDKLFAGELPYHFHSVFTIPASCKMRQIALIAFAEIFDIISSIQLIAPLLVEASPRFHSIKFHGLSATIGDAWSAFRFHQLYG